MHERAIHLALALSTVVCCSLVAQPAVRAAPAAKPVVDLPETITLDDALELLRQRSPRSQAELARADVVAAERVAAGVYPNPSLSYGGVALAAGANTGAVWQHQLALEQPVLLGQRGARRDVAELKLRAERARVAVAMADRTLGVRRAFVSLLARQARLELLEQSLAELRRLERIVRGRQEAGDKSRYDVARTALEVAALDVELRNARTEVEDASGALAALLGFSGWRPRAAGDLAPQALPAEPQRLWETAARRRPAVVAARAQQAVARGGLVLARRERLPVPAVAIGAVVTQREDSGSIYLGLSLPLPLFDRGQGGIAQAKAEIAAEERAVVAELAEAQAELQRAHAIYQRHRETLRTVERELVERIPEIEKMAEASYQGGGVGILELLDAYRSVREIRLTGLGQREAVKQAEAELLAAAGL